jgi:hypothetical protein
VIRRGLTGAARRARRIREEGNRAYVRPPSGPPDQVKALSETLPDESFITGNGIAAHCRYIVNYDVFSENGTGHAGWWFCKSDYLDYFFAEHAPAEPYVLFSHNSDRPIDGRYRQQLNEPQLIAWFTQNPVFRHPKLFALPIGVANPVWAHGDQAALKNLQMNPPPKSRLFDVSFDPETNPTEREHCLAQTGLELSPRVSYDEYLRRLREAYFCISPSGNGIDCHHTWEALYLRTIPVVTRSLLTDQHPELPMIVLNDWSDFTKVGFAAELYERVWGDWDPQDIRLDRYLERVERTIAGLDRQGRVRE